MKESNESFHDFMYECAYAYISHVRTLLYTFNCVEAVVFGSWADFQAINVEVYKVFTHTKFRTVRQKDIHHCIVGVLDSLHQGCGTMNVDQIGVRLEKTNNNQTIEKTLSAKQNK